MKPKYLILFKSGRSLQVYGERYDMGDYFVIRTPYDRIWRNNWNNKDGKP